MKKGGISAPSAVLQGRTGRAPYVSIFQHNMIGMTVKPSKHAAARRLTKRQKSKVGKKK